MKIGLAAVLRDPVRLLDWAERADAGPFARIGVNDRIVYDSPDIMVMVAAAPVRAGGPEILFGGFTPTALARVARWGDGFICSTLPEGAKPMFDMVRHSWQEMGRDAKPLLIGQVSTALGPESIVDEARSAALEYYGFMGDYAHQIVQDMLTTANDVRDTIARYDDLGADEIMLGCWADDIDQIDRLADLVG